MSVITRFSSFIFKIYLSRKLGAEILGVYQICMSLFVMFACFSATGIPTTLSRKTAEQEIHKNAPLQQSLFTTCLLTSAIIATAFCLFFVIFKDSLHLIFHDDRCVTMFMYMLPALISTSVYCTARGWFWGKKDFTIFSVSEFFEEILKIVFTIFLLSGVFFSLNNMIALALAFTIADFISAIILIILYIKKGNRIVKPTHFVDIAKSAAPLTTSRILSSFVTSASALILPILLTKYGMSTAEATAAYGRASGMALPLLMSPASFVGALAIVLIPELAGLRIKGQKDKLEKGINNALLFSIIISSGFFALFFALGKPLGTLLYKDSFAGVYVAVSAVMVIPMCLNQICVSTLNSLGFESKTFKSNCVGLTLMLACILIAPRLINIYALTFGLLIFHIVTLCINIFLIKKHTKLKLWFYKKGIFQVLLALASGGITLLLFNSFSSLALWLNFLLCAIILIAIYIVNSALMNHNEISALKKLKKR